MAKLDLNRVPMPKQQPGARAKSFNEVALGYEEDQALAEASRCIQCKKRNCVAGCPVGVDIPEFILALREGNMSEAVRVLKGKNALPSVQGGLGVAIISTSRGVMSDRQARAAGEGGEVLCTVS